MNTLNFEEIQTNQEIIQIARNNLDQGPWDYLVGGAESETTMRRNRLAFDKLAFKPRVLIDTSSIDTTTEILGIKLRIPVLLAPIGSQQHFTKDGASAATKAAHKFNVFDVISSVSEPDLETIAEAAPNPKIYQLYIHGDEKWTQDMISRAVEADYKALCITVDTPRLSRRERPMLSKYDARSTRIAFNPIHAASVTWDSLDKINNMSNLPLILKGIATKEDAKIALDHGAEVIWVSNHGGRQLDYNLGTMDMLPEIVEVVNKKAKIVIDGGVQRGSDIAKAIALGADCVAIGKLQCWGLAAGGETGLIRSLEILEDEYASTLSFIGVTETKQLNQKHVCASDPVNLPHEMSSWVNFPNGRLT